MLIKGGIVDKTNAGPVCLSAVFAVGQEQFGYLYIQNS